MFPLCMRYAGDRAVAEDMLRDGFITLFTRLDSYKGEGSFEGWARRIFVTTALMSLEKEGCLENERGNRLGARHESGNDVPDPGAQL